MTEKRPPEKFLSLFRKVQLKHQEQFSKKNNLENDFLNKMKNYCRQRGALDLQYGIELQKLSQQCQIDEQAFLDVGFSNRSLYCVWNSYLEDGCKVGKQHENLAEFYTQNMTQNIKALITAKTESFKKCFDRLSRIHTEMQMGCKELDRFKREYSLACSAYQEIAQKATVIREKIAKKQPGLFHTIDQLERENEKLTQKLCELSEHLSDRRNCYRLALEALSSHQKHYREVDLLTLVIEMENNIYSNVWTYLSAVVTIEKDQDDLMSNVLQKLSTEIEQTLSPEEHQSAFLGYDPSLRLPLAVFFEQAPQDSNGPNLVLSPTTGPNLSRTAKQWVASVARHRKQMQQHSTKLHQLIQLKQHTIDAKHNHSTAPSTVDEKNGLVELGRKIDQATDRVRQEQTALAKAQAIVQLLKDSGVEVNTMELEAQKSFDDGPGDNLSRHSSEWSLPSVETESVTSDSNSFNFSTIGGNGGPSPITPRSIRDGQHLYEVLFDYMATQNDELNLTMGETITILENEHSDWPRGQKSDGTIGLIPKNYIKPKSEGTTYSPPPPPPPLNFPTTPQSPPSIVINGDNQSRGITSSLIEPPGTIDWCTAEVNYEIEGNDELEMMGADLIAILDKCPNNIDDGWWLGENLTNGKRGTFPSLVTSPIDFHEAHKQLNELRFERERNNKNSNGVTLRKGSNGDENHDRNSLTGALAGFDRSNLRKVKSFIQQ